MNRRLLMLVAMFLFVVVSKAQVNLQDSLIISYPFNGNANDESGNEINGDVHGAVLGHDRFGVNRRAYLFDGVNDYISVADNPSLFSDSMTISWWYKLTETPGPAWVVIGWVDGGYRYQQFFTGSQISYFNGYNLPAPGLYFNPTYILDELNVWKHVVVTYKKLSESASATSIFVDGEFRQTDNHTLAMAYAPGVEFLIGKNSNGNHFKGFLDDIKVFNRILNPQEISALFNDSSTYNPPAIRSVYPLQNAMNYQPGERIKVCFSQPMNVTTINDAHVFVRGNIKGTYPIDISFQEGDTIMEIQPLEQFNSGEMISVTLDNKIQTAEGHSIIPFILTFYVKPSSGSIQFVIKDSLILNYPPNQIAGADVNNDQIPDVVVASYDSSKVVIAFNDGKGKFYNGSIVKCSFKPTLTVMADIDNDNDLDMMIPAGEQGRIYIFKNNGSGYFHGHDTFDISSIVSAVTGDFNGDGDIDFIAMTNSGFNYVFDNSGDGDFTQTSSVASYVASIRNIAGDIDNDGDLDIIGGSTDYWGRYQLYINDGNGDFSSDLGEYIGPNPDEIAGGDLNGDSFLDFIKCDWYQDGIQVAYNDGNGRYIFNNLGGVASQPRNPNLADYDADGDLDAAFKDAGGWPSYINSVGILRNEIAAGFTKSNTFRLDGITGLTSADFDNNGSVDIAVIISSASRIKFLMNCADSLVAYFPFSESLNDLSGNENNGINHNCVFSKDRFGIENASIFFDGIDSYIEGLNPGNNLPAGNSQRSFTAWIKLLNYNEYGSNIFHYGTAQYAPTNMHFLATDVLGLGNGYGYGVVYGHENLVDSTWHFVASTYNDTSRVIKLYIDGKPDNEGIISEVPNTILSTKWRIGRFLEGSTNFHGNIDELKIFNVLLSDQTILDMYKATTTAPVLLYPPDHSSVVNDLTPVLDWDSTITTTSYRIQLSADSLFTSQLLNENVTTSHYSIQDELLIVNGSYYWRVRTSTGTEIGPWSEIFHFETITTGRDDQKLFPEETGLSQNYPNPFCGMTVIEYQLPVNCEVDLSVYDILGRKVSNLVNDFKEAGEYKVEFNTNSLPSGIYYYRLSAENIYLTRKMIIK